MKRIILMSLILTAGFIFAETLFEVKDSSNKKVLDVSTDGLRVMNDGDTLMVISSSEIKANIRESDKKGLSRSFSVTTTSSVKEKGLINALEVGTEYTKMGSTEGKYTDFSPKNMFLGLNSGKTVSGGLSNVIIGNESASSGGQINFSTFIGAQSGKFTTGEANVFIGSNSGQFNGSGSFNTYLGMWSGLNNNGSRNTYLGMWSGMGGAGDTNNDNILIGYMAGRSLHGSGNILIGNEIDGSTFNNKLNIGNLITGDMSAGNLSANGSFSVTGTTTSTGLITAQNNIILNGTYFNITTNPGSGATPTNYVYQGLTASTTKSNAFAVNDAFWVTKNAFIDGSLAVGTTLQIKGGTAIGKTQAGTIVIGTNPSANYKTVTLNFPSAFTTTPKISVTPRSITADNDVFAVTVRSVGVSSCVIIICRVDSTVKTWGQDLQADWVAWE